MHPETKAIITPELQTALKKAKVHLMAKSDSAFFTTILFSLHFYWRDDILTAGTDGKNLFFNPHFFLSMPMDEQVGVLVHEAMHVAYIHMFRCGTRNKAKFNMAADYVIN